MKHFYSACVAILLLSNFSFAQYANVAWAKQFTGDDPGMFNNDSYAVDVDAQGNVYTTGYFIGTRDFDPGAAQFNLVSSDYNVFISKLDANGDFVWAKQLTGSGSISPGSLKIDASGNILITGGFSGTIDFDPGPGVSNMTANYSGTVFVTKIDGSGNLIWAKQLGAGAGNAVSVDTQGNVLATGVGYGDFDPGPGIFNIEQGLFISKLDGNGNFVWLKQVASTSIFANSICTDIFNNVFIGGAFTSAAIDADPGPGILTIPSSNPGNNITDGFIIKLNADGDLSWAHGFGAVEASPEITSLATDVSGNLVFVGDFFGTIDIDPGAGTLLFSSEPSPGSFFKPRNAFIGKLNSAGQLVWANQLGNADYTEEAVAVTTDILGNIYFTGEFMWVVDFNPGPGVYELTASCSNDIFIQKLTPEGQFVWAKKSGGGGNDNPRGIAVDALFNVYNTGKFQEQARFDNIHLIGGLSFFTSYVQKLSQTSINQYPLSLGSKVWWDANDNGMDDNESGIPGATVYLYEDEDNNNEPDGCAEAIVLTDASGNYTFYNLQAGNYLVGVYIPEGFTGASVNGGDPDNNRDADNNGIFNITGNNEVRGMSITLTQNGEPGGNYNGTYDFGFVKGTLCLGNRIWNDLDDNGKDQDEPGLAGVEVNIYKVTHNNQQPAYSDYLFTTLTDDNGYFSFCNLAPGKYVLGVVTPSGLRSSTVKGGDPNNHKDHDNNGMFTVETETRGLALTLRENSSEENTDNTYDFGFHEASAPGNGHQRKGLQEDRTSKAQSGMSDVKVETYPNPFIESVNLRVYSENAVNTEVRLLYTNGSVVSGKKVNLNRGYNVVQLNQLGNISAGVYIVEIKLGDRVVRKKAVKIQ